jgi:hypothetical protein
MIRETIEFSRETKYLETVKNEKLLRKSQKKGLKDRAIRAQGVCLGLRLAMQPWIIQRSLNIHSKYYHSLNHLSYAKYGIHSQFFIPKNKSWIESWISAVGIGKT